MNYFFDTSALTKIYHKEEESDNVVAVFNSEGNKIFVTELSVIEYYSVVYRKFREKQIDSNDLAKILKRFENDISDRFEMLMFFPDIISNAKEAFSILGQEIFVRSLDVIQLGFFKSFLSASDIFLTFDSRQSLAFNKLKEEDFFQSD